jgi:plasmid segregation protein ParM
VAQQFGRILAVVGATTEVAYVYGGGAGALKHHLYSALLAKASEMNSEDSFPTLYLDSSYSRHLNREGLFFAAETVERNALAVAAAAPAKRSATKSTTAVAAADKRLAGAAV